MATTTSVSGIPGFQGRLHTPGDAGYDAARAVFNAMIDRRPTVVAVCGSTADVVAAVNFARDESLPLSVYGGGHAVTGAAVCDDGVCLDLRGMKGIEVDPVARTARAEAGLNWASSTPPRKSTGSRSPVAGSPTPASPVSRSVAGAVGSNGSSASPATTCSPPRW